MRRRELLAGVATATLPLLAGCGGGRVERIAVGNGTTDPLRMYTGPGVTIRFISADGESHDIREADYNVKAERWTQDDPGGTAAPDDPYQVTFDNEGIYHYYCASHGEPSECGALVIGAESSPVEGTLPCE